MRARQAAELRWVVGKSSSAASCSEADPRAGAADLGGHHKHAGAVQKEFGPASLPLVRLRSLGISHREHIPPNRTFTNDKAH